MRHYPQPGEVVAKRAQEHGGAANLRGAVLVARRDEPLQSEATDLSNVVPFARPPRQGLTPAFPLPSIAEDERPVSLTAKFGIVRSIAVLLGSLALHSTLLAMFWHQPRPLASIGIEVMSVEVTLGATTPAGAAPTAGEQEVQAVPSPADRAHEEAASEQARAATVLPQEVPVATDDQAPDEKPQETPAEVAIVEPTLQEQPPEPETMTAESPMQPTEKPPEPAVQQRPRIQAVQKAPERKRSEAPTDKKAAQRKQVAAATPSDAASGVGRGRSDKSANYNGMVAAHLARHKQYPAAARSTGAQGIATVSFSIDGSGRVTSARLAAASGNGAIDQEVVAMARRASPFPPPPDGKGRNFTVPVRFNLQ